MDRKNAIEYLLVNNPVWGMATPVNDWKFVNGVFAHPTEMPITIDDWNRAKIKPNTMIEIINKNHLDFVELYMDSLGYEFWSTSREDCADGSSPYLHFDKDMSATSLKTPNKKHKEIFIESTLTSFNTKVLAEKVGSKFAHYYKDVSKLKMVDVYRVCDLFNVNDSSGNKQHAIKKLLCSGQRGVKDERKDIEEAISTLQRKLEMMKEDEATE